jgi:hypothetical protein
LLLTLDTAGHQHPRRESLKTQTETTIRNKSRARNIHRSAPQRLRKSSADNYAQTSRMPTLNVTLTNIEAHPRTAETEPETPYRNRNRAAEANRKPELHSQKFFSALILHQPRFSTSSIHQSPIIVDGLDGECDPSQTYIEFRKLTSTKTLQTQKQPIY